MTSTLWDNYTPINERLREEYERQLLTMIIGGDNKDKK